MKNRYGTRLRHELETLVSAITTIRKHKEGRNMMNSNVQITFECHDDMSVERQKLYNYIFLRIWSELTLFIFFHFSFIQYYSSIPIRKLLQKLFKSNNSIRNESYRWKKIYLLYIFLSAVLLHYISIRFFALSCWLVHQRWAYTLRFLTRDNSNNFT